MDKIELVFISNEFATTDFIQKDNKLEKICDVNDYIWEIYSERIMKCIRENVVPLRFYYIDQYGMIINISHSEYLADIAKITDTVFWNLKIICAP
jgi:hypothetical protein